MNKHLENLQERFENGEFDDNVLIDLLIHYKKENCILTEENKLLYQKVDKLNNVLDEIGEYINKNSIYFATKEKIGKYFANCNCDDLLKMLDEVKE